MASFKPMGMERNVYIDSQKGKEVEEFKFSTNQRIQNLQFAIDSINKMLSDSIANHGSEKKDIEIQISLFKDSIISSLKEFKNTIIQLEKMTEANKSLTAELLKVQMLYVPKSDLDEKISHLNESILKLHSEKVSMRKEFNELIERLKMEVEIKVKISKKEILETPTDLPKVKILLDQNIELSETYYKSCAERFAKDEQKILMLEKKILNIYELMKEFKISNQVIT